MPQHIGVIGVSPEGSSIFTRALSRRISDIDEPALRPHVTLHHAPFANYLEAIHNDDWAAVGHLLADSAGALTAAGADFCVLPDNATHHALPLAAANSPAAFLNMVEIVADAIQAKHHTQVGLIGTKYVTFGSTYQTVLGLRGIKLNVPELEDALEIDRVIFDEAVKGTVSRASTDRVARVIAGLADLGCEAIVLGASEASLILKDAQLPLPVIDPVEHLADATLLRAADEVEVA